MKLLGKIYNGILNFCTVLGGILIILLMLIVTLEVCLRYFFNAPTIWASETAGYMQLYFAFLVAAWVLKRGAHVKMDLLLNRLSPRKAAIVNAVTSLIGAAVFVIIAYYSASHTIYVFNTDYRTTTLMRVPQYAITLIIPVGSFLLFIEFLVQFWKNIANRKALPTTPKGEIVEETELYM